jgi:hypothetical protein
MSKIWDRGAELADTTHPGRAGAPRRGGPATLPGTSGKTATRTAVLTCTWTGPRRLAEDRAPHEEDSATFEQDSSSVPPGVAAGPPRRRCLSGAPRLPNRAGCVHRPGRRHLHRHGPRPLTQIRDARAGHHDRRDGGQVLGGRVTNALGTIFGGIVLAAIVGVAVLGREMKSSVGTPSTQRPVAASQDVLARVVGLQSMCFPRSRTWLSLTRPS